MPQTAPFKTKPRSHISTDPPHADCHSKTVDHFPLDSLVKDSYHPTCLPSSRFMMIRPSQRRPRYTTGGYTPSPPLLLWARRCSVRYICWLGSRRCTRPLLIFESCPRLRFCVHRWHPDTTVFPSPLWPGDRIGHRTGCTICQHRQHVPSRLLLRRHRCLMVRGEIWTAVATDGVWPHIQHRCHPSGVFLRHNWTHLCWPCPYW